MHFRVKEVQGTAYITRFYDNRLKLEIGDFFYPEEVSTLQLDGTLIYWNDNTGETFTVDSQVPIAKEAPEPVTKKAPEPAAEPTAPAAE